METITKEDIIKVIKIKPKTGNAGVDNAVKILTTIEKIMNNPMVTRIAGNMMSRFGLVGNTAGNPSSRTGDKLNPMPTGGQTAKPNPDEAYNQILGVIDILLSTAGDVKISEVKEYMIKNKKSVTEAIKNVVPTK